MFKDVLATVDNGVQVSKLLFLSLIIAIVVIPTRLSKGAFSARRVVRAYLIAAVAYGVALLYVIPKLGV